jgi:RNA polymerase-interacting CarD/CdnL/TRCF family regulator
MAQELVIKNMADLHQALDTLAEVAIDQKKYEWGSRNKAMNALIKAGAIGQLAQIARSPDAPQAIRNQAVQELAKIVSDGRVTTLTQTEIEGILKVHSQTMQISTR